MKRERHHIKYGSGEPVWPRNRIIGDGPDIVEVEGRLYGVGDLRNLDLSEMRFNLCDFSHPLVKLKEADFRQSEFIQCNFRGKGLELIGSNLPVDCYTFGGMLMDEFDAYCMVWLAGQIESPAQERILRSIPRDVMKKIERFVRTMRHQTTGLRCAS